MIGDYVKKYESGARGPMSINDGAGDPGGASYGTYQLASRPGTLDHFLRMFNYTTLLKLKPGTKEFNTEWKRLASDPLFAENEHTFIQKTHYEPVREFADKLDIPSTEAINECLWSMCIQHGGVLKIVKEIGWDEDYTEKDWIEKAYDVRRSYIQKVLFDHPKLIRSLMIRYANEEKTVMSLVRGK